MDTQASDRSLSDLEKDDTFFDFLLWDQDGDGGVASIAVGFLQSGARAECGRCKRGQQAQDQQGGRRKAEHFLPLALRDDPRRAVDVLVAEASSRWLANENVIDDTTIIVAFLDVPK